MKKIWSGINDALSYRIYERLDDKGMTTFYVDLYMVIYIIAAFVLTYFLLRAIKSFLTRRMEEDDKLKFASFWKYVAYIVYLTVLFAVLSASGINLTFLFTASAAIFVAIGFALQDLFKDVIGGIFIMIDKSLAVNDVIELNGRVGRVFEIKLRTTRALTRDDKVIIIPNHQFMTETLYNYTQNHAMTRESVKVGVAYGSDTERVKQVLLDCLKEQSGILMQPQPLVLFEDFGDSSLNFGLYFYVANPFVTPRVASEIRFSIDHAFRNNGITIPFPQRDLHIISQPKTS